MQTAQAAPTSPPTRYPTIAPRRLPRSGTIVPRTAPASIPTGAPVCTPGPCAKRQPDNRTPHDVGTHLPAFLPHLVTSDSACQTQDRSPKEVEAQLRGGRAISTGPPSAGLNRAEGKLRSRTFNPAHLGREIENLRCLKRAIVGVVERLEQKDVVVPVLAVHHQLLADGERNSQAKRALTDQDVVGKLGMVVKRVHDFSRFRQSGHRAARPSIARNRSLNFPERPQTRTMLRSCSSSSHLRLSGDRISGADVHATVVGACEKFGGETGARGGSGADGMARFQLAGGAARTLEPLRAVRGAGAGPADDGVSEGLGPNVATRRTRAAAVAASTGIPT